MSFQLCIIISISDAAAAAKFVNARIAVLHQSIKYNLATHQHDMIKENRRDLIAAASFDER